MVTVWSVSISIRNVCIYLLKSQEKQKHDISKVYQVPLTVCMCRDLRSLYNTKGYTAERTLALETYANCQECTPGTAHATKSSRTSNSSTSRARLNPSRPLSLLPSVVARLAALSLRLRSPLPPLSVSRLRSRRWLWRPLWRIRCVRSRCEPLPPNNEDP